MSKKQIISIISVIVVVGGLGLLIGLNRQFLSDQILALTYQPSNEIANIENSLQLTSEGQRIFRASQPAIEDQEAFNEHCQSHNVDVSVLGCYTNAHIYLYNVDKSELQGIKEATAAHELLHAAWARLSDNDKNDISAKLDAYYNEHKNELGKEMGLYNEEQRLDELHSRVGTEGKNLPSDLSAYYAKYFYNQAHIVSYYDFYNGTFKALQTQADKLLGEIDELKAKIESQTNEYKTRSEALSSQIAEFNQCANTADCFSSQYEFNNRRNALIDEQQALEQLYQDIDHNIHIYNQKVKTYNANVFRTRNLQNSINSNSQPPKV